VPIGSVLIGSVLIGSVLIGSVLIGSVLIGSVPTGSAVACLALVRPPGPAGVLDGRDDRRHLGRV
jgi:hypothetical protein